MVDNFGAINVSTNVRELQRNTYVRVVFLDRANRISYRSQKRQHFLTYTVQLKK